jgi:ABC-type uncharacterized transport system permease subunit
MTPERKPTMRGAVAGSMLIGAIVLCALIGLGVGALLGAAVPLTLAGLFAGLVIGFVAVHARFRDL